ncbi:MAG: heat-shock protein HtpX [Archangium gephyra]|uniref:Heat-shock protein HtpX n=1 Tax=Archangium gephyra TaxID=48 RepID=A0A2W5T5C4_9BACT|nr:MAG: heat-shock protein HtpX [Archangium gephyra]
MTGYLAWLLLRLGRGMVSGSNPVGAFLLALPAGFLFIFLVRGLFLVKHSRDETLVELSRDQQPRLFAFIERLADETKAPRPHRVFLSARVNAAVFYELSFFNLIFPSRKNLELGLGLVNVLTLDELKAVVAHELGHFAQRSMAVGRWTYVASQIAGHIVASRGRMDDFLNGLSRIDLRIAWVGWGMRLVVWSLRALLDTVFRIVVLANRALSREMEFQADRVAVSVSGSDSLIHALHRLGAADDAWNEAGDFVMNERRSGRPAPDLFQIQTRALESLRAVLDGPGYGATPKRGEGAKHRVFDEALAQPPRMWLTHPPSREREDHAKAVYVPSPLDERSAWVLLENEQQLREQVTDALFAKLEMLNRPLPATGSAEERFARRYAATAMSPRYRGTYMGRAIAAWDENYAELIEHRGPETPETIVRALDALYPASLRSTLAQHRERAQEEAQLEGIAEGFLTAPGGAIRYQGRELRRKELPAVLEGVRAERKRLEDELRRHDRSVRSTHLAAAKLVGHGWAEHLEGLLSLLHVVTHTRRAVADEHAHLHNVLNIVLADRSVSASERSRVLSAALWLHQALVNAWAVHAGLTHPDDVKRLFEAEGGWETLAQKLGLPAPHEQQLGEWLQACDSWALGTIGDFYVLGEATLNALLQAEDKVSTWVRTGETPEDAPKPAQVPKK